MKKVLALILAMMMAFSLVACGGDQGTTDEGGTDETGGAEGGSGYKIGFSNFSIGNSWRQQMEAEFVYHADELKAEYQEKGSR